MKKLFSRFLPLNIGPFAWFVFVLQFYYLYQVFVSNDMGGLSFSWQSLLLIPVSMISVMWFFQILSVVFGARRWPMVMASFFGLALYDLVIAYQFSSHDLPNWSVLIENLSSAFSGEAFDVIIHSFDMGALGYLVGFVLLFLVLEWRKKTVSRGCQSGPYRVKLLSAIVIYLGFIFVPAMSYDPLVNFFRSIYHYYFPVVGIDVSVPEHYRPTPTPSHAFWTQATPHFQKQPKYVFLILCESLNFSSLGTPSTPFMTQLKDKSVYVEPFYGNSIQTAKGHFASLFSVIPSISGKEYVKYKTLDVDSVASVMKRAGYSTLYFAAHHNKNFDKESAFLLRNGYDEYEVVKPYLKPEDVASKFKWGVEDRVFFKRFFDYFSSYSDRPVFVTLATIANHFPFNSIPVERRLIHKDPKNIRECYANSIRLTDEGLKVFFDELERRGLAEESLVIVTGDHAFPLGEHGNYHLEAGYHEESFRIPFFMVWKGHLMPQKIIVARSQMDMGPTIVDVLKLPHIPTYFQGRSIFSKGVHPLYLIQPYGKHLSILLYPYKYRFYTATQQEFVYDLSKDAMEKHNIVKDIPPKTLLRFREELNRVYLNQEYIERNLLR